MANEVSKEKKNDKKVKNEKDKKSFAKDFRAELKKVSWPTPKQLVNNTSIVIVIVLITAAIVFVLDVVFETLNNYGVEALKAMVTSNSSENVEDNSEGATVVSSDNNTENQNVVEAEITNTVEENKTSEEVVSEQ